MKYEHVVAEGAGAIAIGPVINGDLLKRLERGVIYNVVAVITGSHIDVEKLKEILENERVYERH
ncbi:hypothetical protein [Vulcanisaeta sp. JCM 16159]|uniref:hypothetical protein n=1 Tax=Vulcanisaeta sp. JCM 16159 TaxID=1295371 RepID=UPI000B2D6A93|nr:hypothetical protein [Vulcanisaeta sp. JCM 16159]